MIFLWNPTNEDMEFQYGGINYTLFSKKRMKVLEPMGNHALNALGSRGLTKLVFDDDGKSVNEDQNEIDSIERNKQFKIKQIVTYNERNERRKASGQPYDTPTTPVRQYAAELGIALLEPYNMALGEKAEIFKLNKENEDKDRQLKEQVDAISRLSDLVNKLSSQIEGGFVKAKEVTKTAMIVCDICGEEVLASKLESHMKYNHKEKSGGFFSKK